MSAPASHDPVAVNTSDDRCWVRRGWSADGHGLYALEGTPQDGEQTLYLIRDLAEFGLRSMVHLALPMPAGPVDGEHYAATHHTYRVPRDLPELGGQR